MLYIEIIKGRVKVDISNTICDDILKFKNVVNCILIKKMLNEK